MNQDDYTRGVAIAEQELGAECRDFDRAIWGMMEAISAAGRKVSPRDIAHRWHCPLASADKRHCFALWSQWWQGELASMLKRPLPYECEELLNGKDYWWRYRSASDAVMAFKSDAVIERETASFIDAEIKRAYPKTRRNSKRYAELALSVRDKARGMVTARLRSHAEQKLGELDQWLAGDEKRFRENCAQHAVWYAELAADVLALDASSSPAKQTAELAERISAKLAERIQSMARQYPDMGACNERK